MSNLEDNRLDAMLDTRIFTLPFICPITAARLFAGLLALALLTGKPGHAESLDLKTAVRLALVSEAQYRATRAELDAIREEKPRARSALLPSLSITGSRTNNRAKRTFSDGLTDYPDYTSEEYGLILKQPLFRRDNWIKYQQADTRIASAEQLTDVDRIKLILNVSEQYLDCLYTDAVVRFARAEVRALEGLLTSVTRGFSAGATTRTDILDAEARLDAARVKLIEAEQNIDATRRALEASIGQRVSAIYPIQPARLVLKEPNLRIDEWRVAALTSNPEIQAAQYNVQLAKQEIQLQRAGHYPTLDLIAQRQLENSGTITTIQLRTITNLWGVQFNIPIFSGGYVTASTRQAVAQLERAKAELDFANSEVALRTAKAVEALHASSQRVQALSRAETSAAASLTGTEKGLEAGTRSFVDVLNARQQLLEVMQSRARANADFVMGLLNLKASTGLPDETAVDEANAFLSKEEVITFPNDTL
ncbi:MAG: TolC family outer membrane protein [Thiobacillus sp.]|nr:TolC family outer membrane protein [Thiobacillus sp.]